MCGIAGILGTPDRRAVENMAAAMETRGPDDVGFYEDRWLSLGHRRLSILDLSEAGHQPMSRAGGKLWIVYNGEIFNFKELRRELEGRGQLFQSRSDTEVILALYEDRGVDCVEKLRGMFAFAIWDLRGRSPLLFLARDHFGVKPLVYAETDRGFVFASDLPALRQSGRITDTVDQVGLLQYLTHGHVVQPRTILQDARMLLPGHAMTVQPNGSPRIWRYWDLDHERCRRLSAGMEFPEQVGRVRSLLECATRSQMVSDVPLGAFLSGGVDSSALVALMARAIGRPVHTYSVGYAGVGGEIDETAAAGRSASYLRSIHESLVVTGEDVAQAAADIARRLGQPTVDGVNVYFVSRAARRGVTVALTGLGADEMFGGYPTFGEIANSWGKRRWPRLRLGHVVARTKWWSLLPEGPIRRDWEARALRRDLPSQWMACRMIRTPGETMRLTGQRGTSAESFVEHLIEDDPAGDPMARVSRLEAKLYMGSQLLRDADAASMAHSLEVRVPYLDLDLVEFAYGLPGSAKLGSLESGSPARGKRALILAIRDLIPDRTYLEPKRGFGMPFAEWLKGPLLGVVEATLNDSGFRGSGLLERREIDRLRARVLARTEQGWTQAWSVFVLALWWRGMREQVIGSLRRVESRSGVPSNLGSSH